MPEGIPGERLRRDIHPAEVLLPDGTFIRKCRVFITSHRLLIFRWVGEIDELEFTLSESVPANKATLAISERLEVKLPEGTAHVNRAFGCNCGPLGHARRPINF